MNNRKKVHDVFARIWRMFNNVRKDNSDASWERCVNEAGMISKENPEPMYEKILLAVIKEAEEESKLQAPEEKAARYKAAAKAFNEAWGLYESLMDCLDVNAIAAYCHNNTNEMARKLAAAVYEAACGMRNTKGTFAETAYAFYEKYQDGIKAEALAEAEGIMVRYPEYTLQILNLYEGLKKTVAYKAA